MLNILGRLLVRKDRIAGLFLPMPNGLAPGIYEIRELMGEYHLKLIGQSCMQEPRLNGLELNGLMSEPHCIMTTEELRKYDKPIHDFSGKLNY
jgi:hypothetical protein